MKQMNKSYQTAISRNKISQPMKYLSETGKLSGLKLDYGCGKGFDASHFHMDKFDPYYFNHIPAFDYDTITCNYVLNVIESERDIIDTLYNIQDLLSQFGIAYITVRRDIKQDGLTQKGTFQSTVFLNLKSIKRTSQYEIYELTKHDDLNCLIIKRGKSQNETLKA